ncbi:hypothetical protein [Kitasatospora sp. NPDC057936]|uniref:hypothetical protein n=1 Tax=Kitasatospora sp. NPDC057936 TaxID=3346283 RepID=UPI0036DC2175
MRSARTLLAGAAVAAVLTVGTPMAFADGSADQGKNLTWQEKQPDKGTGSDEHKGTSDHKGSSSTEEHKGSEEHKGNDAYGDKGEEHKAPHGGVHTGGGGLSLSGGGLASGAVLLLGGIGAGALALRRGRRTAGAVA